MSKVTEEGSISFARLGPISVKNLMNFFWFLYFLYKFSDGNFVVVLIMNHVFFTLSLYLTINWEKWSFFQRFCNCFKQSLKVFISIFISFPSTFKKLFIRLLLTFRRFLYSSCYPRTLNAFTFNFYLFLWKKKY